MDKRLIIFTDGFPYGKGEKTFILPELVNFVNKYNVSIVSCIDKKDSETGNEKTYLDERIQQYVISPRLNKIEKVYFPLKAIFSKTFWVEIRDIVYQKECILNRIKDSILFYAVAQKYKKQIMKSNLLSKGEKIVAYTIWNTSYTLAMAELKNIFPDLCVVSRTHRYDLFNEVYTNMRQPFKKYINSKLNAIFFISDHGCKYWKEHYSSKYINPDYYICRLGVRRRTLNPSNYSNTFQLVSCSNIISVKRIELIIDGLAEIDKKYCIKWVHFGDGELRKEIEIYAHNRLKNKKNVEYSFLGHQQNEEIMEYYRNNPIDCFITTTKSEGLPVSIMEALAFGIPIIATDVDGNYEEVDKNGILLSANPTPKEIADSIISIYDSEDFEIKDMRTNSYKLWENKFDLDRNTDRFEKILSKYF